MIFVRKNVCGRKEYPYRVVWKTVKGEMRYAFMPSYIKAMGYALLRLEHGETLEVEIIPRTLQSWRVCFKGKGDEKDFRRKKVMHSGRYKKYVRCLSK